MAYIGNPVDTAFTSLEKQDFSNPSGTSLTLAHAVANANDIALYINNVRQEPTEAYSVNGTTVTLTGSVSNSDDIYVIYLARAMQTTVPGDGSVSTVKIADGAITTAKLNASVTLIPTGMIAPFGMSTAPTGWLECNGAAVSRTTYSSLFSTVGTSHGTGDGASTFNVPDLRGEFIRGFDNGKGTDSGRTFASSQTDGIPRMRGQFGNVHGNARSFVQDVSGFTNPFVGDGSSSYRASIESSSGNFARVEFDSARVITASDDVRPRNIALMYCIKT